MPQWMITSKTILLPKNAETEKAKNYRPIACLNIIYKLFTGILNIFIEDHCESNNILTVEQAGGKKGSWGCTDQLLINKMILDEVRKFKRNIFTMWFDYRKAFDSIPHTWLYEAMKLAKIPDEIVSSIRLLSEKWATEILIQTKETVSITDLIQYLCGILQGDCLSLILFVLCVNPLSHILNDCPGYMIGQNGNRNTKITHLLFVDDLKTYASNRKEAMKQLEVITEFTRDIGMEFGADKCAYMNVIRGVRTPLKEKIFMNGLELNELEDGDSYKYLGQDENIQYDGKLNKERVVAEYFRRVRKIWNSELYSKNKVLAHNIFAVPILLPTFGILNWTKEEVEQIDIKTRKLLTLSGNFHRNSSPDRLYSPRMNEGRGLSSVLDVFVVRMISTSIHLEHASHNNRYLMEVKRHEKDRLLRTSSLLQDSLRLTIEDEDAKSFSKKTRDVLKKNHVKRWTSMKQHGFVRRKQLEVNDRNEEFSEDWLKMPNMSSHVEGYVFAIQEQEINTRALQKSREHKEDDSFNNKCRYCKSAKEDLFHLLCSCSFLSASMYLPMRHNEVAKVVYNEIARKVNCEIKYISPKNKVWKYDETEIWWDTPIKTTPRTIHNKPDLIVWDSRMKLCKIIDICVPLDENVKSNEKEKRDKYAALAVALKRLYPEYTYSIIPIVVGATGLVTNSLLQNVKDIGFNEQECKRIVPKLQQKALLGSMKVIKSAMCLRK